MKTIDYWRRHAGNMAPEIAKLVVLLADGSTANIRRRIETIRADWKQQMEADGFSPEDVGLVLDELVAVIERHLAPPGTPTADGTA